MKKILSSSQREKTIFILCCVTLLIFIVYRGLYIPLKNADESIQDKILLAEKQLSKQKRTISESQPFEQDYPSTLSCLKQTAPDEDLPSAIISELNSVAEENHLTIKVSPPAKFKTTIPTKNFSTSVFLEGSFEEILKFLYVIQSCPYLYNFNEFQLNTNPSSEKDLQTHLVLTKSFLQ
jgi:hypothetical protein